MEMKDKPPQYLYKMINKAHLENSDKTYHQFYRYYNGFLQSTPSDWTVCPSEKYNYYVRKILIKE